MYYLAGDFNVGVSLAVLGISSTTTGMYVSYSFIKTRLLTLTGQAGLAWIYAHLFSLSSFKKTLERSGEGK